MPRSLIYDSVDEANNRLANTVVTYEGRPVWIDGARNHADGVIRLNMIEHPFNSDVVRKRIDSPAFNRFRSPPLGFCNYFDSGSRHVLFCQRTSPRSRRQGLCSDNLRAEYLLTGNRERFDRIYRSEAFKEMIEGSYPEFDEVMRLLVPDSSIAVDREFALLRSKVGFTTLMYKTVEAGIIFRGNLYLSPDHQYLTEMIMENRNLPDRIEIL